MTYMGPMAQGLLAVSVFLIWFSAQKVPSAKAITILSGFYCQAHCDSSGKSVLQHQVLQYSISTRCHANSFSVALLLSLL